MNPTYILLLAAFLCLPLRAPAQRTQQPVPTQAMRERAMQVLQRCENVDEMGKYDPASCYGQHVIAGVNAAKHQRWNDVISQETDAITLLVADRQRVFHGIGPGTPGGTQFLAAPYIIRAAAYEATKQYSLAISDATSAIAITPADPVPWNDRCWNRAITGNLAGALQDCQKARQLAPKSAYVLDSTGFVYLKMKNYPEAISSYQAALALQPKSASSLYGLGLAEQALGNQTQGAQHIATAQQIDPQIATNFGT